MISSIQILLIGCSQSKATEQIKTITYQQWVEEHIPAPDTLNDKQLALEAARLTVSICNEEQVQHIFYSTAERFAIPQFSEYAGMLKNGKTDICDRMKVSCLEQLLHYAENHFSKTSYEYTYIAWALTHQTVVRETFQERKKVFSRLAETLYKTEPSDRNKELYLADNCVLLDLNGTEIIPYGRYLKIYDDFISGFSRTLSNTHLWGVIDINGNEIIKEGTFNKIWPIKNDYSSIVVERERIRYEIPFAVLEKLQEELKIRGEITTSVEQYLNYKEYLQQDFLESGEVTLTREELQN